MSFVYKNFLKPILFIFNPEIIHGLFIFLGRFLGSNFLTRKLTSLIFNVVNKSKEAELFGLRLSNPIGLSAGFDKNANLLKILPSLGFGFATIGTITLEPYKGNPPPRLWRLKKSKGLIVNFGLKNDGVEKISKKIISARKVIGDYPIILSIGKTNSPKTATLESGITDYIECVKYLEKLDIASAYEINISCPNTFGGEPFTTSDKLEALLAEYAKLKVTKPTFIKMPINLSWEEFKILCDIIVSFKIEGVTISNLTKVRDPNLIIDNFDENLKGGISGKPTFELSNELIKQTKKHFGNKLKIIGVGGVFSPSDAKVKFKNGADLVALITGMIFEGPMLIKKIVKSLDE